MGLTMAMPLHRPSSSPTTHILGFPLHVRPGFFLFMALIVLINSNEFGFWLAGSVAVLTLIHELGHALAARAAGARAEISLDFLAGYASFVPSRPMSRSTRAGVAFAGPAIHIAVSTGVLLAMGANPLDLSSVNDSPARFAIFWAGPVIGLFNLLPVLPLDGGNIVETGLSWFLPDNSRRVMLWISLTITVVGLAWLVIDDERRGLLPFGAIILLMQLQLFYAGGDQQPDDMVWNRAAAALRGGDPAAARRLVQRAVAAPTPMTPPTEGVDAGALAQLLDGFGPSLPVGNPVNEHQVGNVLLALGQYERAAHYGAASYARHPSGVVAATTARACNAAGDPATAIAWLRTAATVPDNPAVLAQIIDHAPELGSLRMRPEVVALRRTL